MENKYWKIDEEKTQDHWLEVYDNQIQPSDGGGIWYRAICKWDGCIHFSQYSNVPYNQDTERKDKDCCDDYIHICDIDDYIDKLIALREIAREFYKEHHYFNDSWGKRLKRGNK